MDEQQQTSAEKLIQVDIDKEMRDSFLEYSMSVIVQIALPDVRDGFKPVHRRIIYTMDESGNTYEHPYRKCAYTVGEVLGKYHPHGDSSVYDAMVRLAQDFSMRYPLVDGHGNFGSVDGDPPAAYRYTEARMSKIAGEMMLDINKNTVDFGTNYDDKIPEPKVLPSRFPNLLVNGSIGIAVGMATNIPPHNLREAIDAINMVIKDRDIPPEQLMTVIKGPDFPTGGIIMGRSGIRSAYMTGRGKIILRGRAEIVEEKTHTRIVVTEIPYMVNKSRLLENIGALMRDKRIEGISVLRDESDRSGMKIVMELKRDANANVILNKLYNYTQLQDTVGVILLALVDGQPKILTLKEIITNYIDFQIDVIRRRTAFDLKKAKERAHLLQGFMLCIDNIDEVVAILRSSKSIPEGKERLMERFKEADLSNLLHRAMDDQYKDIVFEHTVGLSSEQADAIVQMRLGQLTGLEREKIESELAELMEKIKGFMDILSDESKVLQVISEELETIKKKYGDERRTSIEDVSGEVDIEDLIPVEESVITFTNIGYIKRQPIEIYNTQKRGGKGVSGMKQRDEDFIENLFVASSHDDILFVTNLGNMYKLRCYEIPEGGKQSRGVNVVNILQLSEGERVAAMMKTSDFAENKFFICITKQGKIKRTPLSDYKNLRTGGLRAVGLDKGDEIASAFLTEGDSHVMIGTRNGMAINFLETDIRSMGRTAHGVKAIKLRDDDYIVGACKVYDVNMTILTITDKGMGRRCKVTDYRVQKRGGFGMLNYKANEEKGYVCGIRALGADDDVILINTDGVIIRIRANDIRVMGRYATGVRVMKLYGDSKVVTFTRTEHDDTQETEQVEEASEEDIKEAELEEKNEILTDDPEYNEDEETEENNENDN